MNPNRGDKGTRKFKGKKIASIEGKSPRKERIGKTMTGSLAWVVVGSVRVPEQIRRSVNPESQKNQLRSTGGGKGGAKRKGNSGPAQEFPPPGVKKMPPTEVKEARSLDRTHKGVGRRPSKCRD